MVHMQGGQQFPLNQTGKSGTLTWFNNTRASRYTLKYDGTAYTYTLTVPTGASMVFNLLAGSSPELYYIRTAYSDTTGLNSVTYSASYVSGDVRLTSVTDDQSRTITITPSTGQIAYGSGQGIALGALGVPAGCGDTSTADSQTLQVLDAI